MKPIAATRIFDELPPMEGILNRKVTVLGSTAPLPLSPIRRGAPFWTGSHATTVWR